MYLLIAILFLSFISALSLTPVAIRTAHRTSFLDKPSSRKIHVVPTPLLGGMAVFLGFAVAFALGYVVSSIELDGVFTGFTAGAIMITIIGLIDDGLGMTPGSKLFGQILTAILFLTFSRAGGILMNTPLDFTIAGMWMITLMNALNFLDNMDGLCSGISFCAALGFAVLGMLSNETFLVITGVALMGALTGFMYFNFNPAKIFLGDAGSMFLGYSLASMGIVFAISHPNPQDLLTPLLIMSYPLFDISFVTFTRFREGRSLSQGGKDHTSHRLVNLGIRSSKAVWGIFAICFLLAILGNILYLSSDSTWKLITVVVVAFLLLVFGVHLSRNFANVREKLVLLFADTLGLNLAFLAFYFIKYSSGIFQVTTPLQLMDFIPGLVWITFYWLFLFGILGQYDFTWDRFFRVELIKLTKSVLLGIAVFIVLSLDFSSSNIDWLLYLSIYAILIITCVGFSRGIILKLIAMRYTGGKLKRRTFIIGTSKTEEWFKRVLSDKPNLAVEIVGRIGINEEDKDALGNIADLSRLIKKYRVTDIVILESGEESDFIHEIVRLGNLMEIQFKIFPEMKNYIRGLKTEKLYYTEMLKIYPDRLRTWEWGAKRLTDLVVSAFLLIITSPMFIISFIMIKLNVGGNPLIFNSYYGQGREIIRIPKFRVSNMEFSGDIDKLIYHKPESFWGRFLRFTGLERLPALISVLTGKMSLVGPTPDPLERGKKLSAEHPLYKRRWAVKPGIISFASLLGRNDKGISFSREGLDKDLKYLEQMSMLTDFTIILSGMLNFWTKRLSYGN
ncbi:MAG: hypothetical protein GF307_05860 [candidate division Zixibacteria bacterium]|nr:hypothetical protein [candidate division Zixibacteria bacterium]